MAAFFLLVAATAVGSQDADHDGLPDVEEEQRKTDEHNPDTDGDGLLDGWEVYGFERDGFVEPLDLYGCDPLRKDVLVEIDWMESPDGDARPAAEIVYLAAVDLFRVFRDSETGIQAHIDLGPEIESLVPAEVRAAEEAMGTPDFNVFRARPDPRKVITHQDRLPIRPLCQERSAVRSLYDLYFDAAVFRPSRRNVFYYILFAESHQAADVFQSSATGVTTNFADEDARRLDLRPAGIQVGAFFRRPTSLLRPERRRFHYAASLLHELGHGLGLGHGGATRDGRWIYVNRKPNYPSVMNRRYQFWGVALDETPGGPRPRLDFSWGHFAPVQERRVFEPDGLGPRVPNPHILELLGVAHIESAFFTHNLDWDHDGEIDLLTYPMDLNSDNAFSDEPFTDHDDWGKFLRDGFDGIGLKAFRCSGLGCALEPELVRTPADLNGDGLSDLLLLKDRTCVLYLARTGTPWGPSPTGRYAGQIDSWTLSIDDQVLVANLDGDASEEVLFRRDRNAAVVVLEEGRLQLVWGGEPAGDVAAVEAANDRGAEKPAGWTFDRDDVVRVIDLVPGGGEEVLISRGDGAAVLALRSNGLATVWSSPQSLREWTSGEPPVVLAGRKDLRGGATFLVRSDTSLTEFDARLPEVPGVRLDDAGVIPADRAPDEAGWRLSGQDCFRAVDLDGDGLDELLVHRAADLGVFAERGGRLVLVWSRSGELEAGGDVALYSGQFIAGGGDEIVLLNGRELAAFAWNGELATMERIALATESLIDAAGRTLWRLADGRVVYSARVLRSEAQVLIVHDADRLFLVGIRDGGFQVLRLYDQTIAGWSLAEEDRIQLVEADADDEKELSIRKRNWIGIVDLSLGPRLLLAADVDDQTFELRPLALFKRGDSNLDGSIDLSDVIVLLDFLFRGRRSIPCASAADADDNGELDISDGIRIVNFLFISGSPPGAPGPWEPGIDPSPDKLECGSSGPQ
jgi:hypothetical protein